MRIKHVTSLTDAAQQLGLSYVGARNWAVTGKLRAEQRLGRWFVDADHLAEVVERRNHERRKPS